ncbi:MAG: hypothetical protein PUA79_03200 [Lachnospiraceae bacterium]|nr:hypothetical protein [Lachnospiraceae bacterium]
MYRKKITRHLALLWSILFLVAVAGASTKTEQVSQTETEAFAVNYIELKNVRLLDTPDKMLSREEQVQNTGFAALPLSRSGEQENHRRNIGTMFCLLLVVLPQLFMGRIQRNRKKHGDNVLRSLMLARFERKADGKKEALALAY